MATKQNNSEALNEANEYYNERINPPGEPSIRETASSLAVTGEKIKDHEMATKQNNSEALNEANEYYNERINPPLGFGI